MYTLCLEVKYLNWANSVVMGAEQQQFLLAFWALLQKLEVVIVLSLYIFKQ